MGIVYDPELAKATNCHCYAYNGKDICWSSGIIGTLSAAQEEIYCNPKTIMGPVPPKMKARYSGFVEAVRICENLPKGEFWSCMGRELEKRGIEV